MPHVLFPSSSYRVYRTLRPSHLTHRILRFSLSAISSLVLHIQWLYVYFIFLSQSESPNSTFSYCRVPIHNRVYESGLWFQHACPALQPHCIIYGSRLCPICFVSGRVPPTHYIFCLLSALRCIIIFSFFCFV